MPIIFIWGGSAYTLPITIWGVCIMYLNLGGGVTYFNLGEGGASPISIWEEWLKNVPSSFFLE